VLSNALTGRDFILGEQFSAADVMIGSTLAWAGFMGLLADHPTLQAYAKRLSERPAFQRAQS
jgi:glutathione S-transferase